MKRLLLLFLLCFGLALPGVAADGTSFNPTTISVKSVGASIPVGTVITWPSNSWPSDRDNWLECNGQSISSAVYPELVGVVGGNVPNYQGVFLRGYGGQTSYHYGAVGHWSAGLGELQGDGIREIWGELSYLPRSRDGEVGQSGSLAFWNEGRNQWMNDAGKAPSGAMNFYASRSTPVVGEVRPVNRAVRYLIRAR
ncbi:phage tail protein [Bilophila sp.]|uniref:phage tail protein n=1 Tax=Bilophila sp. TaxID=1929485 RepID=UPI00258084CA|nr:phage tail protein [Bilophila sp.]MBS5457170.1 tail fiber protein [Bilophila sp.]